MNRIVHDKPWILHFYRIYRVKLNEKFPRLYQFFGAYFNQDWMEDYESEVMAVKAFVRNANQDKVNQTLQELDRLLSLGLSEMELDKTVFEDLGCYYDPEPDGQSMSDWLRWIRSTMAKYAEEKMAGGT